MFQIYSIVALLPIVFTKDPCLAYMQENNTPYLISFISCALLFYRRALENYACCFQKQTVEELEFPSELFQNAKHLRIHKCKFQRKR